jgi:tetraspanin-11
MLITFFVILAMIFFVMMTGGILGYIFRNEVDEKMHSEMLNTIQVYGDDAKVTEAWDAVQRNVIMFAPLPDST